MEKSFCVVFRLNRSSSDDITHWCPIVYALSSLSLFMYGAYFCLPVCLWWMKIVRKTLRMEVIQCYTTRQPGILCGWSGRLEQSTTGHSFGTYIINVQKHAEDTSVFSILLQWLTVSQSTSSEHCTAPL